MERDELERLATPEQLAAALDQYRDDLDQLLSGHEHDGESVREVTYKGHHIRIVTRYRIEVDGAPVTGHFLVNNAGKVHYHAIPNQDFDSAVDVVKRIIDLSTDDGEAHDETNNHDSHGIGA
jgi:hypothetical protein